MEYSKPSDECIAEGLVQVGMDVGLGSGQDEFVGMGHEWMWSRKLGNGLFHVLSIPSTVMIYGMNDIVEAHHISDDEWTPKAQSKKYLDEYVLETLRATGFHDVVEAHEASKGKWDVLNAVRYQFDRIVEKVTRIEVIMYECYGMPDEKMPELCAKIRMMMQDDGMHTNEHGHALITAVPVTMSQQTMHERLRAIAKTCGKNVEIYVNF